MTAYQKSFTGAGGGSAGIVRESSSTGGGVPTGAGPYTHTVTYPTGIAVDDYLVLTVGFNGGPGTISLEGDGWTLMGSATAQANPDLYMYGRKATSAWSGNFTFTTSANLYVGWVLARYSGVNTVTPQDATAVGTDGAAATTYSLTGITTVTDGAMLVVGVACNSSTGARLSVNGGEPVTEYAEVFESSAKKDTMAADGLKASAGATGTIDGAIDQSLAWAGVVGALRPASATILYDEGLDFSLTTTTWTDVAEIAAGSLVANKTYLILVSGFLSSSSASIQAEARAGYGTTPTVFTDGVVSLDVSLGTDVSRTPFQMLLVHTQGGTAERYVVQVRMASATNTVYGDVQLTVIRLSDEWTENTDYQTAAVTADYTTTASWATQASTTFTPNGSDPWLIFGWASYRVGIADGTSNGELRLQDSVAGTLASLTQDGEDTTNDIRSVVFMQAVVPTAASHTFSVDAKHAGSTASTVFASRIFALNLAKFAQRSYVRNAGAIGSLATSPSWTNLATISPTPDATGNWLVLSYATTNHLTNTSTRFLYARQQINASGGGLTSVPAYGDNAPNQSNWKASDQHPLLFSTVTSLTSGSARQINLDGSISNGTGNEQFLDRSIVAVPLLFAATGDGASLTFSGATTKKTSRSLAGALTFSGAVTNIKAATKALAGALTFVGSLAKKSIKPRSSALTFTGTLQTQKSGGATVHQKSLPAALSFTGTLQTQTSGMILSMVPLEATLTLIPPEVGVAGTYFFSRPFSLGGVGTWTLSRPFDIVQAGVTYNFHRYFDIIAVSSPYIPPAIRVNTTLAAQASAGQSTITVVNPSGIVPGVALQLNMPYGERVRVAYSAGTTVTLANRLIGTYASGATVDEANLYIPAISVFDKRGVLLGMIETPLFESAPTQSLNNSGTATVIIPRNIADRALLAPDRIVVIGNSQNLSPWAGLIRSIDWGEGKGQAEVDDLFTAIWNAQNVKIEQELPDNTLASTVAQMIVRAVNDGLQSDGQVLWGLDATGTRVYRGDVDYDESAASAMDELALRAGIEFTYRVNIVAGRVQPYLVVRDRFEDFVGPTITDENIPRSHIDTILWTPNLRANWNLDDEVGAAEASDRLGYFDLTVEDPVTFGAAHPVGIDPRAHAASFSGSGYLSVASATAINLTTSITVAALIKPAAIGSLMGVVSKGDVGATTGWSLNVNANGTVGAVLYSGPTTLAGTTVLTAGSTYHVAVTFNGEIASLYVNGRLENTVARTSSVASSESLLVGARKSGSIGSFFNGVIANVALWARGLTDAEVLELHRSAIGAATRSAASIVGEPRYMTDPAEKVNAITVTGIETDIANLVPDWARWAVKEVEPKVTRIIDLNESDERRMWDKEVSVEWSLSKAQQKQIAEAILDRLWTMYQSFLRAFHDRYGRIFHEGWKYEGPPDSIAAGLTRDKWWTRLELIEAPTLGGGIEPASLVMASSSKSRTNLNRWLIVRYDRLTQKQSVEMLPPELCLGPTVCKVTVAANGGPEPGGQYRLWRVSGGVYTSSQVVTVGTQQIWPVDSTDHRIASASVPAVTYKYGGYNTAARGTYTSKYNGVRVRKKPYTTAGIVKTLSQGQRFVVRQKTVTGTKVSGSRVWYGDYTGDRWVHSSLLTKESSLLTSSKMLRRIQSGTYAGWWLRTADDGYTLSCVRVSSVSGSTATYNNALLNKIYDVERQSIHLWDPRRDGIGQLVSRPTVFFGSLTTRQRWQITPWIGGGGGTSLLAGITPSATVFEVESYMEFGQGRTDFMITVGEGAAAEDMQVTDMDGNKVTVIRAQNGTTAILHEAGETVQEKNPQDFDGFEIDYDWPEGEAWADEYLAKASKDIIRLTVVVPSTFPTAIGRLHTYRGATEGPGPDYNIQIVRQTSPAGLWPLEERASYRHQLMSSDAFAYWRLADETDTTATDESGNARNGTYTGTYTLNDTGPFDLTGDGALSLTSGSVTTSVKPTTGTTGHLTVGCWFKVAAGWTGAGELVRAADASYANGFALLLGTPSAGKLRWALHTSVTVTSPGTYNDGRWHFAAGVLDRTLDYAYLYVDGVMVASADAAGIAAVSLTPTNNTVMGTGLVGTLAQVFIQQRAYSPEQVMALYASATRTHEWRGNGTTGAKEMVDVSGNAFHGTGEYGLVAGAWGPATWDPTSFAAAAPMAGDGYVTIPHQAALDPGAGSFTIAGWWKFPVGAVNPNFSAAKGDPYGTTNPGWSVRHSTTADPVAPTLWIGYASGDTSCDAPSVARGTWAHYAWVVDRTAGWIYPYKNGALGTPIAITIGANSIANTSPITLLRGQGLAASGVTMAHFGLWTRALTKTEVAALYDPIATPSTVGVNELVVRVIGVALQELEGTNELLVEVVS